MLEIIIETKERIVNFQYDLEKMLKETTPLQLAMDIYDKASVPATDGNVAYKIKLDSTCTAEAKIHNGCAWRINPMYLLKILSVEPTDAFLPLLVPAEDAFLPLLVPAEDALLSDFMKRHNFEDTRQLIKQYNKMSEALANILDITEEF